MVFSSVSFLFVFLPVLLACYYIIPKRGRGLRNFILLAFSLFFYAYSGLRFLLLMLISIALNYFCGLLVDRTRPQKIRRLGVALAAVGGLGLLGWFKYAGFLAENINRLGCQIPVPEIVLPIGISFFTFQGLSYVIDVYRGDAPVQKNPLSIALYISMFPQLVAGPIVRYTTVAEEISLRQESLSEFSSGAVRFVFGLSKKLLLANALGSIADSVFAQSTGSMTTSFAWLGALAYTGQIYFDFSAYSDMAIGLGRMFGFHFLENFNYPYISQSVTEFWRRWHISLSTWFRDYVYIPLGGNRHGKVMQLRNLAIVWLLTGLWHGAAWTFIAWGVWYGVLLIGEKFIWGKLWNRMPALLRYILTMVIVVMGWVLFRADTLTYALQFWGVMFGHGAALWNQHTFYYIFQYLPEICCSIVAVFPLKIWLLHALERRNTAASNRILAWAPPILAVILFALSYIQLVTGSFNPFIYFQF